MVLPPKIVGNAHDGWELIYWNWRGEIAALRLDARDTQEARHEAARRRKIQIDKIKVEETEYSDYFHWEEF